MKKVIKIEGMHCSHCSARVEKALAEMGITVSVNLAEKYAEVEGESLDNAALRDAIEDLGFEVVDIE